MQESEPGRAPAYPHPPLCVRDTAPHGAPGTQLPLLRPPCLARPHERTLLVPSTLLFWNVPVTLVAGTASFKLSRETSWRGSLMK